MRFGSERWAGAVPPLGGVRELAVDRHCASEWPSPPLPCWPPPYAGGMNTIHLTDDELEMARHGMTAFLRTFGHDEADTAILIRAVLARLAAAQPEQDSSTEVG